MYRVRYLSRAVDNLREIRDYIALDNPLAADRLLDLMQARIAALKDTPYIYEAFEDNPVYRRIVVSSYLVFYTVNEEKRTVEIHRILHGAKNIAQWLSKSKGIE